MAARKIKRNETASKVTVEKTHSLWLAGLGEVSIVQKQGADLLTDLSAEGRGFQQRTEKLASEIRNDVRAQVESVFVPLRARPLRNANEAGATFQRGVAIVLAQLGIPSKAAIDELSQRVAALNRRLKTAK